MIETKGEHCQGITEVPGEKEGRSSARLTGMGLYREQRVRDRKGVREKD